MNSIARAFSHGKAFIPFITCGDPDLETTKDLIIALEKAGADLIELGIPFSDPIAEGPVIQKADERALSKGVTTDDIFSMVASLRSRITVPLVFMTYINPVYTYGSDAFMRRCREIGMSGIIVPDMPYEEQAELSGPCRKNDITLISMIAPTSAERVRTVASHAEGFLYCVSSLGVTGMRNELGDAVSPMIAEARKVTSIPCAVGFGISNERQAARMAELADGIIVGSAIVDLIATYGRSCIPPVTDFVHRLHLATRNGGSHV